jgi:hypothetical protein
MAMSRPERIDGPSESAEVEHHVSLWLARLEPMEEPVAEPITAGSWDA